MAYQQTKNILQQQGLAPSKKLGQNFLVHRHTAERIVDLAGVQQEDIILEVGVGLGALTRPLAMAAAKIIGLEADSGIVRMHEEQQDLPENVELVHQDVLKADFSDLAKRCGGRLKILANLPYSISSPFLFKLIENHEIVESAVVMLQKEVGLRLTAKVGSKQYGAPTVLLASCAEVKILMQVDANEFHPRPKVDSVICKLQFYPVPQRVQELGSFDYPLLKRVVNGAFGQRRKTLLNALAATGLLDKPALSQCIEKAGFSPSIRAERLQLEDFVRLSRIIYRTGAKQ